MNRTPDPLSNVPGVGGSLQTSDLAHMLVRVADETRIHLRGDLVQLWFRDREGLRLVAQAGKASLATEAGLGPDLGAHLGPVLAAGQPRVFSGLPAQEAGQDPATVAREGVGPCLAVPVLIDGESVAVLALVSRRRRRFSPAEVAVGEAFAASVAVTLGNASRRGEGDLSVAEVGKIAHTVAAARDADEDLQEVCRRVAALCGAEDGSPEPQGGDRSPTIAGQAALAMDGARLHQETEERLRTEDHLEITRILGSTLKLKPLLKEVTRQAARVCHMDRCSIFLWQDGMVVPMMSQYADGSRHPEQWQAFKETERRRVEDVPYCAEIVRTKKPLVIDNPARDPRWTHPSEASGTKVVVPLIRQSRVVGSMVLTNLGPGDPVRPEQVARARTIASQVALAIDNARLYDETQRRLRDTQLLLQVARTMSATLDRVEIARQAARGLAHLLGADTTLFFAIDEAAGCTVALAGYGVPKKMVSRRRRMRTEDQAPFIRRALDTGRPVATSDLPNDPQFDLPVWHDLAMKPRSLLYAPVMSLGRHRGSLVCMWWKKRRKFSQEEIELAAGVADQMALVLANVGHYERAQQALADLKAAQERLVRSEKLRALAEMAGGVAHDFNNLLTAILGQTEVLSLLLGTPRNAPDEIRSALETIELAARDGAETVRRLLDYTRTKGNGEMETVDVNQLLEHTRKVSRPRWKTEAQAKGIGIEVVLEPGEVPPVRGNPAELREVLLNLVFNAIDAMPQGGTLTLGSGLQGDRVTAADGVAASDDGGGRVVMRITDTGVGIPKDIQERIFDPFFSTKGEGSSGLGLSASYGIIHRHGGEIEVESEPGRGTTFMIKLPL